MCHWRSGKALPQGTMRRGIQVMEGFETWLPPSSRVLLGLLMKDHHSLSRWQFIFPHRQGRESQGTSIWPIVHHPFWPIVHKTGLIAHGVGGRTRGSRGGRMREGDYIYPAMGGHHPCWEQTIYCGYCKVTYAPTHKQFILISKPNKLIDSSWVNFSGVEPRLWLGP